MVIEKKREQINPKIFIFSVTVVGNKAGKLTEEIKCSLRSISEESSCCSVFKETTYIEFFYSIYMLIWSEYILYFLGKKRKKYK